VTTHEVLNRISTSKALTSLGRPIARWQLVGEMPQESHAFFELGALRRVRYAAGDPLEASRDRAVIRWRAGCDHGWQHRHFPVALMQNPRRSFATMSIMSGLLEPHLFRSERKAAGGQAEECTGRHLPVLFQRRDGDPRAPATW
jgi:hypothetical protein